MAGDSLYYFKCKNTPFMSLNSRFVLLFQVEEAVLVARNEPPPPLDSLYSDIYHNTPPQFVRGATVEKSQMQKYCRTGDLVKSFTSNA